MGSTYIEDIKLRNKTVEIKHPLYTENNLISVVITGISSIW